MFLARGLEAALEWLCRVQDMGEAASDSVEDHVAVLLRVRPCTKPVLDPVGDKDISGSFYTKRAIPACRIEFWHPTAGWRLVTWWDDEAVLLGVREEDDEFKENPIHWTFACWEDGGFKPPRSAAELDP